MQNMPPEIHQLIYERLNVIDRVNFYIALPKHKRIHLRRECTYKEKQLHVVTKAIQKKRVSKLTRPMKEFLSTCRDTDPTVDIVKEAFPGEVKFHTPLNTYDYTPLITPLEAFIYRIENGVVTKEDLDEFLTLENISYSDNLKSALSQVKPSMFDFIHGNSSAFREHVAKNNGLNYICNAIWRGPNGGTLLEHILQDKQKAAFEYDIHFDLILPALKALSPTDLSIRYIYMNLIKIIPFSKEELELLWVFCVENMLIEAACAFEKAIKLKTLS